MSKVSVIAVTQRVDCLPKRLESRDALDQRLIEWVTLMGGQPLPVPNVLGDGLDRWLAVMRPTAVLLSGGNDIGTSPNRDLTETRLLQHAELTGLPVLGVCRGMQMLARYAGAKLVPISNHASTQHTLIGDSVDRGALPPQVDSFHSWGLESCPAGYSILASAPDGSIEAIRRDDLRWEGWMWHPERKKCLSEIELLRAKQLLIGSDE